MAGYAGPEVRSDLQIRIEAGHSGGIAIDTISNENLPTEIPASRIRQKESKPVT